MGPWSLFQFEGKTFSYSPPPVLILTPTSQGSGSDTYPDTISPEKTGKGPVAHRAPWGVQCVFLDQGRTILVQTCLGTGEETLRSQMQYLLRHQTALAGTGPKLQAPLTTEPTPQGHDKPTQCSVSSQAKAASGATQGARAEDVGARSGERGALYPLSQSISLRLQKEEGAYSTVANQRPSCRTRICTGV